MKRLRGIVTPGRVLRVAADAVLLNAAFAAALGIRFLGLAFIGGKPADDFLVMWDRYLDLYLGRAPMLTLEGLVIFALAGFYTRTLGYQTRYKALVILNAVTIFVLLFAASMFAMERSAAFPRAVVPLLWVTALLFVGGTRLIKDALSKVVEVRPVRTANTQVDEGKVLVVGGCGYVGSVLCRDLLAEGFKVRVLDNLMFGIQPIEDLLKHPNFELLEGDFRHVESVVRALYGMGSVVHLGALVGDPACNVDADLTKETNFTATRMIREVARGYQIRRFLFASTSAVYGHQDDYLDENSKVNPLSAYARSKLDAEQALLALRDEIFQPTILRLATIFGWSYRPRFDLVVNLVTAMAVVEEQFKIINGQQWRPFIHVRDVSRATIALLRAPLPVVGGEVFNVGDNDLNHTLHEVGAAVQRVVPAARCLELTTDDEIRNYRVRFDKLHRLVGFRCQTTLEDGIREIVEQIRAGGIANFRDEKYSNVEYTKRLLEELATPTRGGEPRLLEWAEAHLRDPHPSN